MKRHILPNDPAHNDQEWCHEECNLHRRAERHAQREIHLILNGYDDGCDMLCGVSNDWEQDQTHKRLGDVSGFDERVDAVDEILGTDRHSNSHDNENNGCGPRTYLRLFFFFAFAGLVLGVEEACVGAQLEDEVEHVKGEEDDGGAMGEDEDVCLRIRGGFGED
jgi:hypothetical protein